MPHTPFVLFRNASVPFLVAFNKAVKGAKASQLSISMRSTAALAHLLILSFLLADSAESPFIIISNRRIWSS